jgi:crotonobetainyl-CoA:carnitine CoA-transferase CaiB-like acyl-CoA transferase
VAVLNGLRVVDFTAAMAGPTCSMLLADFGADVIKIEPPGGEFGRRWGKNRLGPGGQFSGLFIALNRNKRSLEIDLKSDEGRRIVGALLRTADVVLENYKPGVADRLGVGYDQAREANPAVVYCSISGFGQNGPLRYRPGIDMLLQAYAGHMSVTGEEGRPSIRSGPSPIDMLAGTNAAYGIMLALLERERTGEGQYLDTSLYDASLELMTHFIADYTGSGVLPGKSGQYFAFSSPYGIFNASDREFFVGAGNQHAFESLCRLLGRENLITDPRFLANPERIANRSALNDELFPIFAQRTAQEWVDLLTNAGVPTTLIEGLEDVVRQEQAAAREMLVDTGVPRVRSAGIPVKLSKSPGSIRKEVPQLGADNDAIVRELTAANLL